MAMRDPESLQQRRSAVSPAEAVTVRARYQAPRILCKRSVVDATLQVVSGGCDPGTPGCGVGGH